MRQLVVVILVYYLFMWIFHITNEQMKLISSNWKLFSEEKIIRHSMIVKIYWKKALMLQLLVIYN